MRISLHYQLITRILSHLSVCLSVCLVGKRKVQPPLLPPPHDFTFFPYIHSHYAQMEACNELQELLQKLVNCGGCCKADLFLARVFQLVPELATLATITCSQLLAPWRPGQCRHRSELRTVWGKWIRQQKHRSIVLLLLFSSIPS